MKKSSTVAKIIPYRPDLKEHFIHLNLEWLNAYFEVEPHDVEVLYQCEETILSPGGFIFFLQQNNAIVGTYALLKMDDDHTFELTKMAVSKQHRGNGFGSKMLQHSLQFAKDKGMKQLVLYSNRRLKNAIHLYKKFGFVEVPLEENNPYQRGDIKMMRDFSSETTL